MSEAIDEPQPGRPRKDLSDDIITLLKTTDRRAMTLGAITEEVDGSRRTVDDRLGDLVGPGAFSAPGRIRSEKIGNATAYWYQEPETGGGIDQRMIAAKFHTLGELSAPWAGRFGWAFLILSVLSALAFWNGSPAPVWGPLALFAVVFLVLFVTTAAFASRYSPKVRQLKKRLPGY